MTEYLTEQASHASQARRESLKSLLIAILESNDVDATYQQLNSKLEAAGLRDLARARDETPCRLLYDEPTKAKNHDRTVILNGLRFAIDQILEPTCEPPNFIRTLQPDLLNWVRWVRHSRKSRLTPVVAEEVDVFDDALQYSAVVRSWVDRAVSSQIEAHNVTTALLEKSFLTGSKNPLKAIVVSRLKSRSVYRIEADAVINTAIVRLYSRIDNYRPGGNFLAWWGKLVDRCILDMLTLPREIEDQDPDPIGFGALSRHAGDGVDLERFDDDDWKVIQGWEAKNVQIPVVVLVGVGWLPKVKQDDDHWKTFSQWLQRYGVDDPDEFYRDLHDDQWTTSDQLRKLAIHSGRKENTVRKFFHRSFAGIQQSTKQTSFGKVHHIVELSFFWRLGLINAAPIPETLRSALRSIPTDSRVAALCCAPAWPLVRGLREWREFKSDYPFQSPPPLFEFLRTDLDVKAEHRDRLPPSVRNNVDKLGYIREQILAHGTSGELAECQKLVSQTRGEAASLEAELREQWNNAEIGG